MPRSHTFLPFFMGTALTLSLFTIFSCNGNGGASHSEGEIYMEGVPTQAARRVAAPRTALAHRV